MKYCFTIILLLLCNNLIISDNAYWHRYEKECNEAILFYMKNKNSFENAANNINVDGKFLFSIVAPEISQYRFLQDKVESYALKVLYISNGQNYSDFSIGYFQMKPSFVEEIERHIAFDSSLDSLFSDCLFSKPDSKESRLERISRLEDINWQLKYLEIFCIIVETKSANQKFSSIKSKLKFYSSAYNIGFNKTIAQIEKISEIDSFPHFSEEKYKYYKISWFFYLYINKLDL